MLQTPQLPLFRQLLSNRENKKPYSRKDAVCQKTTKQLSPKNPTNRPSAKPNCKPTAATDGLDTAPTSEAGKRRSSLNATRSGLHGQIICATAEELAVLQKHTSDVRAELAPIGPTESFLTTSISDNMFRINRLRALETGIFASGFRANIDDARRRPSRSGCRAGGLRYVD